MSNTAERWWVRLAARWLARVDGVSSQIRVASLGVTAFSTFSLVLQNSGRGELVVPLGIAGIIGVPIYVYLYTEGGVWNQVQRDKEDMSANFSPPKMLIDDILTAVSVFVALYGRPPTQEEMGVIVSTIEEQWMEYRDGIDLSEIEELEWD